MNINIMHLSSGSALACSPKAELASKVEAEPIMISIVLLPGFSQLGLVSFMEPLRLANMFSDRQIFQWTLTSSNGEEVASSSEIPFPTQRSIGELGKEMLSHCKPDLITVFSGDAVETGQRQSLASFLRKCLRQNINICAVGTAAWILAESDLLNDIRCTIHWAKLAAFTEIFDAPLIRDALFVHDGLISTCAGEFAAFDFAVDFVSRHVNPFVVHNICKHATAEGLRSGSSRQTGPAGLIFTGISGPLVKAIQIMEDNLEEPIKLISLAHRVGISRRQMERLFGAHVGLTPRQYYIKARIDHAKRLIEGTRMSLLEISVACGFYSHSQFSKCFKELHGVSPTDFRLQNATKSKAA